MRFVAATLHPFYALTIHCDLILRMQPGFKHPRQRCPHHPVHCDNIRQRPAVSDMTPQHKTFAYKFYLAHSLTDAPTEYSGNGSSVGPGCGSTCSVSIERSSQRQARHPLHNTISAYTSVNGISITWGEGIGQRRRSRKRRLGV